MLLASAQDRRGRTICQRTDIVFISILAYNGYSPEVKQRGAELIVERLGALGVKRDNILISLYENGDGDWLAPSKEQ